MSLTSLFYDRLRQGDLHKTALVLIKTDGKTVEYSWFDYINEAARTAKWLKKQGVRRGDFVAIIPLNLPESFFALLGIILSGGIPVPINLQLLKETGLADIKKILADCQPKLILHNECIKKFMPQTSTRCYSIEESREDWYGSLAEFNATTSDNDLLIMPYTSGTSELKGVMLTHENVLNRVGAVSDAFGVTENERILSYLPLGHIAELITSFFGQIYNGYTVYFTKHIKDALSDREKFRKNFPSVLKQVKPTIFVAVPRIWTSFRKEIETKMNNLPIPARFIPLKIKSCLVKRGLGFNQTRVFISAAALFYNEDRRFFSNFGISISDIYGQTETAGPLLFDGKVIGKNYSVFLLENNEIGVRGHCVMRGYYRNQRANYLAFVKDGGDDQMVYRTGDIGTTLQGKIFWSGRVGYGYKRDNGEYISPEAVEKAEEKIKKINPRIIEAIVYGANRPYEVALIFCENPFENVDYNVNLYLEIKRALAQVGDGVLKIKNFCLIDVSELELTPTMKVKRNRMLEKFTQTINELYIQQS